MGVAQTIPDQSTDRGPSMPSNDTSEPTARRRSHMRASIDMVRQIVGMGFALVIGVILLGYLFGLDIVANMTGPFADQMTQVETIIGAAITFAVLGVLAYAGSVAWRMFGG